MSLVEIQNDTDMKGVAFRAMLLTSVSALAHKPADEPSFMFQYAVLASSVSEMRAFIANLQIGKRFADAQVNITWNRGRILLSERMGFVRGSFSYKLETVNGYARAIVFQKGLFERNPGRLTPEGVKMMILIPSNWGGVKDINVPESRERLLRCGYDLGQFSDEEVARGLSDGAMLLAYLERRTLFPFPICPVLGFLLLGGLQSSGALKISYGDSANKELFVSGIADAGVRTVISVSCSHDELEDVLQKSILRWNQGRMRG